MLGTSEDIVGKYTDATSQEERNALCPTAAVTAVCASTACPHVQWISDMSFPSSQPSPDVGTC